jgi:hypothetical protein
VLYFDCHFKEITVNYHFEKSRTNCTPHSSHTPPHFPLFIFSFISPCREIVTDKFDDMYALLKPKGVTVSAMLAKAVAEVLKKHPIINAAYVEGGIKFNKGNSYSFFISLSSGYGIQLCSICFQSELITCLRGCLQSGLN